MRRNPLIGVILVLLTTFVLCGFSFFGGGPKYSEYELKHAEEKLDQLYNEQNMGYDLVYMNKGSIKDQVVIVFLDFDEGKKTSVNDKRKGEVGEYEHEYSVSTSEIGGNMVDGWYDISSSGEPLINYSLIEKDGKKYVYTSRGDYSKSMPVREVSDSVEHVLKVALNSMNPVEALESMGISVNQEPTSSLESTVPKPVMAGTSLNEVLEVAGNFGLSRVLEDMDAEYDTKYCTLRNSSEGLGLNVVVDIETLEVLCGYVLTDSDQATYNEQVDFVKGISSVLCPKSDEDAVSSWVAQNIGGSAVTSIDGFEYELGMGTSQNVLYYAGVSNWKEWDMSVG